MITDQAEDRLLPTQVSISNYHLYKSTSPNLQLTTPHRADNSHGDRATSNCVAMHRIAWHGFATCANERVPRPACLVGITGRHIGALLRTSSDIFQNEKPAAVQRQLQHLAPAFASLRKPRPTTAYMARSFKEGQHLARLSLRTSQQDHGITCEEVTWGPVSSNIACTLSCLYLILLSWPQRNCQGSKLRQPATSPG